MATYKNIVDVESVAQATEAMNVLVEDAGSLKKVPAGGMIGGEELKTFVVIDDGTSKQPNMTFSEFDALLQQKKLKDGLLIKYYNNSVDHWRMASANADFYPDFFEMRFVAGAGYNEVWLFRSDDTFVEADT